MLDSDYCCFLPGWVEGEHCQAGEGGPGAGGVGTGSEGREGGRRRPLSVGACACGHVAFWTNLKGNKDILKSERVRG